LPRAGRLRARRLARDDQDAGQPDGVVDLDRRPRPHARHAAGRAARAAEDRVRHRWRWLLPLAAVPVLALLAYGFKLNPRDVPSPLVGRTAAPFFLTDLVGSPVELGALHRQVVVVII